MRRRKKTKGAFYKKTRLGRALVKVGKPGHRGALHRDLHVPEGEPIPERKLEEAARKPGKVGMRARFAENMKRFHKGPRRHRQRKFA